MKLLSLTTLIALATFTTAARADLLPLFLVNGVGTNYTIEAGQLVTVRYCQGSAEFRIMQDGKYLFSGNWNTFYANGSAYRKLTAFPGPCVITVWGQPASNGSVLIEVTPDDYPPDKSAVITERDGPMKCTLEESTDLVNWTQSTSGQTHSLTNANAKKFFRIKLEQDVGQ